MKNNIFKMIYNFDDFLLEFSKNDPISEISQTPKQKFAIFVFGAPGTGKSTFINEYILRFLKNFKIFNIETINKLLLKKGADILPKPNPNDKVEQKFQDEQTNILKNDYFIDIDNLKQHIQPSEIADDVLKFGKNNDLALGSYELLDTYIKVYIKGCGNFIYDSTGNDVERIKKYFEWTRDHNYTTIFIRLRSELNKIVQQNLKRERTVPIAYQMQSYTNSYTMNSSFEKMNPDAYYVVTDNNDEYEFYKLENGKLLKHRGDKYTD